MKRTTNVCILLSFLIMLVLITSGCAHLEISIEVNKDNTGNISILTALAEDLASQEEASGEAAAKLPIGDVIVGAEHKSERVIYEDKGATYIGEKEIYSFKDIETFFKTAEGLKIADLPNGNKRLEYSLSKDFFEDGARVLEKEKLEGTNGFEGFNFMDYDFLTATGMKFDLNIKTEYKLVEHNADKVENGVYTWDLLKRMVQEELYEQATVLFMEYKPVEKESYESSLDKRTATNKLLGIVQGDKDSYGRALNKLGILKGTDAGLELDKGLTRAEGAVMYARLLNLESEIEKFAKENAKYDSGFTDIPEWVKPTINYLHFKNMIAGIGNNRYGSNDFMTEAQYSTLVLRALGYDDSKGDFTWDKACEKIREIGLFNNDVLKPEAILGEGFTRRGMSYISYNALFFKNHKIGEVLIDRFMK